MCGICGKLNFDPRRPVDPDLITRMCATITHRGPDDVGHYVSSNIGLGNCRLAINDLSPAGHMPMANEDGSIWITFNGEIYNYPELVPDLEQSVREQRESAALGASAVQASVIYGLGLRNVARVEQAEDGEHVPDLTGQIAAR